MAEPPCTCDCQTKPVWKFSTLLLLALLIVLLVLMAT